MSRLLEWLSLGAAALAVAAASIPGTGPWPPLLLSLLSILASAPDFTRRPSTLMYLAGLLPALALALFLLPSALPLAAFALALQFRLFLFRAVAAQAETNRAYARDLRESLPPRCRLFVDIDIESEAELASVQEGHLIRIEPGDRLPADGQVTFGSSFVDESPLTGEREPQSKSMGSKVFAGSINKNGSFIYRADSPPSASALHRIADALEREIPPGPGRLKGLILIDALLLLGLVAALWLGAGLPAVLNASLLSAGAAFIAARRLLDHSTVARSAAEGFAWRDRAALLAAARTGALAASPREVATEGRPELSGLQTKEPLSEDGALRLLGPLARRIETDAAFTILREMLRRNIRLEPIELFLPDAGGGSGNVSGEEVRWVNLETARIEGVAIDDFREFAEDHLSRGAPVYFLLRNARAVAAFSVRDPVSPAAAEGLQALRHEGIPLLFLAPDTPLALRPYQQELYVPHAYGGCDETEAREVLQRLEAEGMQPAWVAHRRWQVRNPAGITIAAGLPALRDTEVFSLRRSLPALALLIRLARAYRKAGRTIFIFAVFLQTALFGLFWGSDPRLAALAGSGLCLALLLLGRRPLYQRF